MKNEVGKREYGVFLVRLKQEIQLARKSAYQTVNRQLVKLYLSIYEKLSPVVRELPWTHKGGDYEKPYSTGIE